MNCPICGSPNVTRGGSTWNSQCVACRWVWDDPSLLPSIEVPDGIGEVVGFRAWDVIETSDGPRITSQGYGGDRARNVWNPGEVLRASCNKGNDHRAPDEGCTCGFYAASTREHLISLNRYHRFDTRGRTTVVGEVMMDGKVVRATLGYRGENVWPASIMVPFHQWELAARLREDYGAWGVSVTLDNTLRRTGTYTEEKLEASWCHCGRKRIAGKCPRHG